MASTSILLILIERKPDSFYLHSQIYDIIFLVSIDRDFFPKCYQTINARPCFETP
jgi:ssDNA-specific exonuclease RecJ